MNSLPGPWIRILAVVVLAIGMALSAGQLVSVSPLEPVASEEDTLVQDSLEQARQDSLEEAGIHFVKRDFNHKQQVVVGGVVMLCVGLALVVMNNYNPRR